MPRLCASLASCLIAASAMAAGIQPLTISGRIFAISNGEIPKLNVLTDGGSISVWSSTPDIDRVKCDDMVRLLCYDDPEANVYPTTFATNIAILSHEKPLCVPTVSAWDLVKGARRGLPTALEGVVISVTRDDVDSQWNWITLNTDAGPVFAAATEDEHPMSLLRTTVNARVRLRGVATCAWRWRRFLSDHLILFGSNGLSILEPAAANPFDAPAFKGTQTLCRQTVRGRVIGNGADRIFLSTESSGLVTVLLSKGVSPHPVGALVAATGFVFHGQSGPQLNEALVRTESLADVGCPPPAITSRELFADASGHYVANSSCCGKTIRLAGLVTTPAEVLRSTSIAVLSVDGHFISVDTTNIGSVLPADFGTGYEIEITGLCHAEFDKGNSPVFPTFKGFTVYPRNASDLKILRHPPWWTPLRLSCVIVVLVLVIVAILIWNRMLKVLSERRGRELYKEQITSARANLKVEERTRLAIELHDSISQTLTGVALQIDAATRTGKTNPSVAERFLKTARTMLASCRQELRCCIWDLKSRTFDEKDMAEAVQKTLAPHVGDAGLQIRFNVPRKILSESATHDTLRIIRELAINALRHGQARHLRIAGEYRDGYVRFSVRDDGTGFDPATVPGPEAGHFGLQGIRERIKGHSGELCIESACGRGTKVMVLLLADEKDDDEK